MYIVAKNHKIMVGWDEILHPDLPKTIVVQSWRGQQSLAAAAKQGYSGLLSSGYYLDLMWPAARRSLCPLDPMTMPDPATTLTPEEKSRILGGESCQWAEWVTPENVDLGNIWPRNAVIAERLWSSPDVKDVDSMYARMNAVSLDLEWLGLAHRSARMHMLHRMAGSCRHLSACGSSLMWSSQSRITTAGACQGAHRPLSPLTRMIDAAIPESETARRFSDLVQTYIQSGYKDQAAESQIRMWLTTWRDNDARLQPLLSQTFLQEDVPLSQDLSALGAAGLQTLDYPRPRPSLRPIRGRRSNWP